MKFNEEKYYKWVEETHIPKAVMDMVNFIAEKIGCEAIEEEVVPVVNMWGVRTGYAKGFTVSHCTSSYADGPSLDYSGEFRKWLQGLDFEHNNSYGDNGMDSATNWHDTFWHDDFIYLPTSVNEDKFLEWDDEDEEDDYEECILDEDMYW